MRYFVSYTLQDGFLNKYILSQLSTFINKYGQSFIDCLNNESLNKQGRIVDEIINCDCFILLLTPKTKNSIWVQKEINIAKEYNKQIIQVSAYRGIDYIFLQNELLAFLY